jgi:uncharacterized membrane protein
MIASPSQIGVGDIVVGLILRLKPFFEAVVAPSWDTIGKLAAVAVIRTTLNKSLNHAMRRGADQVVVP